MTGEYDSDERAEALLEQIADLESKLSSAETELMALRAAVTDEKDRADLALGRLDELQKKHDAVERGYFSEMKRAHELDQQIADWADRMNAYAALRGEELRQREALQSRLSRACLLLGEWDTALDRYVNEHDDGIVLFDKVHEDSLALRLECESGNVVENQSDKTFWDEPMLCIHGVHVRERCDECAKG